MNKYPFVSIIIPCRNEERFIGKCLDSIISNNYPKDKIEVFVIDGMSEDGTRHIIEDYTRRYSFIKLVENYRKFDPAAMNLGIKNARGEIIMKTDAHSTYPKDYILKCVKFLTKFNADNVGGVLKIVPREDTLISKSIALTLAHPFGSGNAYIKTGVKGPRWVDATAFGCYRKEIFQKIGLFNENLAGSSDMDLSVRIRKAGGKILLVPEIVINYYADSNLKDFWWHNFSDGVWATYVLKFRSKAWSWRHWVPMAFVGGLISSLLISTIFPSYLFLPFGIAGSYTLVNFVASIHISIRERNLQYLLTIPIVFCVRHFAHGLGALLGLFLVLIPRQLWKGRRGFKA